MPKFKLCMRPNKAPPSNILSFSFFPVNILDNLLHPSENVRNLDVLMQTSLAGHLSNVCTNAFVPLSELGGNRQYLIVGSAILVANTLVSSCTTSSGKAGSCLPLVGSLQYRTLTNCMYWFPLPFQLPAVI